MISTIKKITDILIENKELYDECGIVFTYLNELKINFSNIEYHNIAWQYSQALEIVYSNKLENIDLNIFDVIKGFANDTYATTRMKQLIAANFETTIFVSDYRKNNPKLTYKLFELVLNKIYKYPCYKKFDQSNKNIIRESNIISNYEKEVFEKLINSTYSNNGLYFVGFFIFLYTKYNKNTPLLNVVRSILINLYLMKTKLLFAPTLCISYPLYYNYPKFNYLFQEANDDAKEIIEFTRAIFDLIKQAAIINRAFVNKANVAYSILEELINRNRVLKQIKDKPYKNLFKILAFDLNMLKNNLQLEDIKTAQIILDEFIKQKIVVNISNNEKQKVYMFKELFNSIKKLDKNKNQSTAQIFQLKENLS